MSIKYPITYAEEGGVTRLYDGHFLLLATFNNLEDGKLAAAALNATEMFTYGSLLEDAPLCLRKAAAEAYKYVMDVKGSSKEGAEQLLHFAKSRGGF